MVLAMDSCEVISFKSNAETHKQLITNDNNCTCGLVTLSKDEIKYGNAKISAPMERLNSVRNDKSILI